MKKWQRFLTIRLSMADIFFPYSCTGGIFFCAKSWNEMRFNVASKPSVVLIGPKYLRCAGQTLDVVGAQEESALMHEYLATNQSAPIYQKGGIMGKVVSTGIAALPVCYGSAISGISGTHVPDVHGCPDCTPANSEPCQNTRRTGISFI